MRTTCSVPQKHMREWLTASGGGKYLTEEVTFGLCYGLNVPTPHSYVEITVPKDDDPSLHPVCEDIVSRRQR